MRALAGALLALVALTGCESARTPEPMPAPSYESGTITLTVRASAEAPAKTYDLSCSEATVLCEKLYEDADFVTPPKNQMCTEQYGGPQEAKVEATVDGRRIESTFSRTNGCEIARWDALGKALGPEAADMFPEWNPQA